MKRLISYYLPFDEDFTFQPHLIWENAKRYAYRHGIACVALGAISVAADSSQMPVVATITFGLTCTASFIGSIFLGAALDPR